MKTTEFKNRIPMTLILTLTLLALALPALAQQPTAFSYTGFLLDGGLPANGSNDLKFTLYTTNSGGTALGTNTLINLPVNSGVFVVELDFGDVFDGSGRWLEIAARPGGSANPFTNTFPRQKLTAAPYAAYANNGMPAGAITAFGGTNPPVGWILCDGRSVSRTAYARLFSAISTNWGNGDGTTTFNVPDFRGLFLRGVDNSPVTGTANRDPDRSARTAIQPGGATGNTVGSYQPDAYASHSHDAYEAGAGGVVKTVNEGLLSGRSAPPYSTGAINSNSQTRPSGGNETRPKNAYVNYLIKF